MSFSNALDKLVTIQVPTKGKDAAGGNTVAWAEFAEVWAGIRNLPGTEKRASSHGGSEPVARVEITTRYREGVDETMRVVFKGKSYNIRHVNNYNEQNHKLILTCDTGQSVAG